MKTALLALGFALLGQVPLAVAPSSATTDTNWSTKIDSDAVTGEKVGSARLPSSDGRSILSLACNGIEERQLSLQFLSRDYLGSSSNYVTIRIDQDQALPETAWEYVGRGAYTTNEALIALVVRQIAADEHRITVRALDFENQPHDAVFLSRNAALALSKVIEACATPSKPSH